MSDSFLLLSGCNMVATKVVPQAGQQKNVCKTLIDNNIRALSFTMAGT